MDTQENKLFRKITDSQAKILTELFDASISGEDFSLRVQHALIFLKFGQKQATEKTEMALLLNDDLLKEKQTFDVDYHRTTFFWKNGNFGKIIPCPHVKYRFQDEMYLNDRLSTSLAFRLKNCLLEAGSVHYNTTYINSILATLIWHLHFLSFSFFTNEGALKAKMTPTQLNRVKSFINDQIGRKIFVFELAALLDVSEGYFYEAFKHSTDLTPYECIIKAKIDHAKELLAQSNLSIIQIGMAVGYDNPAHFCKLFKRVVGITPKGYRKLSNNGNKNGEN